MSQARTLVSYWAAFSSKKFLVDHLKLCFLWYDETIIETVGDYQRRNFYQGGVHEKSQLDY